MATDRVLVTGGAGYIGSVLTRELRAQGFQVTVFDNGMVAPLAAREQRTDGVAYIEGDVCTGGDLAVALKGIDAVVHLASIVGDPACNVDPELAWDTNYLGTIRLAEACRQADVRRLVFASTCSNYGYQAHLEVDEWTAMNPQSIYARSKVMAEHYLLSARSASFSPCILRFATVYGLSPRMRFDLAVNTMTAKAVLNHEVLVQGGDQWRPFVHVADAAQAIVRALELAPTTSMPDMYNCGTNTENYTLRGLGELIARLVHGAQLSVAPDQIDHRSYRVNFDRIRRELKFRPRYRVADGIREIQSAMHGGSYHDFTEAQYNNYMLLCNRGQRDASALHASTLAAAT